MQESWVQIPLPPKKEKCSKIVWTLQGNHVFNIYVHNVDNIALSYSAFLAHKITWIIVQYQERYMIAHCVVLWQWAGLQLQWKDPLRTRFLSVSTSNIRGLRFNCEQCPDHCTMFNISFVFIHYMSLNLVPASCHDNRKSLHQHTHVLWGGESAGRKNYMLQFQNINC
jgi:hypothetical protein